MIRKIIHFFQRRHQEQKYQPVVLITGCASGMGLAIAKKLAQHPRYRVLVTARSKHISHLKKEFIQYQNVKVYSLDVTSSEDRDALLKSIAKDWGGVDILVNNAGLSYRSVIEHMDEECEMDQMTTNYLGPIALIRSVLPYMREQGRGKIINISSVSGMLAMPTMASYSASKHALEGASEALWYEMKPLGINVSLVQPGFIRSNSFQNVRYSPKAQVCDIRGNDPYCDYYAYMSPFIEKMMNWSMTTPDKVAKIVMRTIQHENPPLWIPATLDATVFYYMRRFIPRRFFHPLLFFLLPSARKWGRGYSHARKP